jgi:hypothetical protein
MCVLCVVCCVVWCVVCVMLRCVLLRCLLSKCLTTKLIRDHVVDIMSMMKNGAADVKVEHCIGSGVSHIEDWQTV